MDRLKKHGFGEVEKNWFRSYLTNRQQYVVCNDVQFESVQLTNGVPQGSGLSPSLFCLLFNSIVHSFIYSKPTFYADDTEAHCSHTDLDEAQSKMNLDLKYVDQ